MLRISNPTTARCRGCGHPTVMAEFATGHLRVHCGTYRANCTPRRATAAASRRRPRRVVCPVPTRQVAAA